MTDALTIVLLTAASFVSGSLMFSYWIASIVVRSDLREVGDGNPGATNLLMAGGKFWGILGGLLDFFKGAIPVWLARYVFGIGGVGLVLIALAPVFGHAFSPFLRFKGGKAVAVTFGIWSGLTIWEAPTFMGILLGIWFTFVSVSGWAVLFMLVSLLIYYLITYPDPVYLLVWVVNAALIAYKYRADLLTFPAPRPWLKERFGWH